VNGVRQSDVFEKWEDADFELKRRQTEVSEMKRGLRPLRLPDKKFDDLCDYWLEKVAPSKRSHRDMISIINTHLLPFFGGRKLNTITPGLANDYKLAKSHLNNKTTNNHLTLLITMLNSAKSEHWLIEVPEIKKHRIRVRDADYRYLRNEEEVHRFLIAAKNRCEMAFMLYLVAVYTGLRAGELACLFWTDVDFKTRLITVQRGFGGPTKSGDVRYVPILDVLLRPLQAWKLKHPGRWLFTNQYGNRLNPSQRIFQETLHAVLKDAGFPRIPHRGKENQSYITFHGLRHTFASHWMRNGKDLSKLQKILGHKSVTTTEIYSHLDPSTYAEDYDVFGNPLDMPGNVIQLKTKQS
jgi:integrase